jgi:hypothetical protein
MSSGQSGIVLFLVWFNLCGSFARAQQSQAKDRTPSPDQRATVVTSQQRLEVSRKLTAIFHNQDLEISAVAAGQENDTIVFTSEMFGSPEGRLQFIQLYRKNFEALHCQLGFRKVVLSKGTFSLSSNEYDLHCPQTPAERAAALQARSAAVAGLQSDFQREGLPITARLEGPNEDRLAFSYDLFKIKSDRDNFFMRIKQGMESEMCGQGLKVIRLQNVGQASQFTDYRLNCR